MKKSGALGRPSSKGPIRLSSRASEGRIPRTSGESRLKTHIPVPKMRTSSTDRDSRARMKVLDLSSKKRSRSHATPSTPAMHHLDGPMGFGSATSARSRSGSRCGSVERVFKPYKGKLTDIRPIKDHGFQHRAMVRVYNYFQRQPQDIRNLCPMPNTRSIMIQSFVDIMGHLLHHFIRNHGVYKKNYTEEIPKLMKTLYYPGTVSSSWLKTVNAPHAWAHVVALISWLVDFIVDWENSSIADFFPPTIDEQEEGRASERSEIFKSVLLGFEAWDAYDTDRSHEIDLTLQDTMKRQQGFSDEEIERLAKENTELMEQFNDPVEQKAIHDYESLVENVKALTLKQESIYRNIQEKEVSNQDSNERLKDYQNQKLKLEQGLESKRNKLDNLAQVVATQPMSTDDAKALREKISCVEQDIKNVNSYLSELQKIKCGDDMKMASKKYQLNEMCVEFNKEILQNNFSELHKFSVQTNLNFFERDLDKACLEMNTIDRGLEELKSELNEKIKNADCSVEKLDQDLEELLTEKKRIHNKIKTLEEEQLRKRKELEATEAENEKNQVHFKAEYDALKAKTKELVNDMPDIEGLTAQLNESRAREIECQQKLEEVVKIGTKFLCSEAQAVAKYKAQVIETMRETLNLNE